MSLLNSLMSKIFGHAGSTPSSVGTAPGAGGATTGTAAPASGQTAPAAGATGAGAAPAPAQPVDIAAVLDGLAAKNPERLDWKHSIVDLMKLVGMDSSLSARKQLATELHYSGDQNDSASMNIWLQKQVLQKLAQNGGRVPPELLK